MKEVVNEILNAEKACDQILQDARKKANAIRQESEKEATQLLSQAQEEARTIITNAVSRSREQALREREQSFKAISTYKSDLLSRNTDKIPALISEIRDLLLAVPHQKGTAE